MLGAIECFCTDPIQNREWLWWAKGASSYAQWKMLNYGVVSGNDNPDIIFPFQVRRCV